VTQSPDDVSREEPAARRTEPSFRTVSYRILVAINTDNTWSYEEEGRPDPRQRRAVPPHRPHQPLLRWPTDTQSTSWRLTVSGAGCRHCGDSGQCSPCVHHTFALSLNQGCSK
jgi:hypothetical protein